MDAYFLQLMAEVESSCFDDTEFDVYFPSGVKDEWRNVPPITTCTDTPRRALGCSRLVSINIEADHIETATVQQCPKTLVVDNTLPQGALEETSWCIFPTVENEETPKNDGVLPFNLYRHCESFSTHSGSPVSTRNAESDSATLIRCASPTCDGQELAGNIKKGQKASRANKRKKGKLWEFLLELLQSVKGDPRTLEWEDETEGVFKIVHPAHLAELWGEQTSNPRMTFSKMSRALRYYRDTKVLMKMESSRLIYQFGKRVYPSSPAV